MLDFSKKEKIPEVRLMIHVLMLIKKVIHYLLITIG